MSKFDWMIQVVAMAIAGYASMSLIGGFAELTSPRREPSTARSCLGFHVPKGGRSAAVQDAMTRFGITRVSEAEYDVDTETSWSCDLYNQPRIEPSFRNGECEGFRFVTLPDDSLYAALGFQRGDVIQYVNGFAINSPESALTAYEHLREATYLDVEFERHGAILRHRYWQH